MQSQNWPKFRQPQLRVLRNHWRSLGSSDSARMPKRTQFKRVSRTLRAQSRANQRAMSQSWVNSAVLELSCEGFGGEAHSRWVSKACSRELKWVQTYFKRRCHTTGVVMSAHWNTQLDSHYQHYRHLCSECCSVLTRAARALPLRQLTAQRSSLPILHGYRNE